MIYDQDIDRSSFRFQFQTKLILKSLQKCRSGRFSLDFRALLLRAEWYSARHTDANKLRSEDLLTRTAEMSACSGMAASGLSEYKVMASDAADYGKLAGTYEHAENQRLLHFIQRHGELAHFVDEDAAGKR